MTAGSLGAITVASIEPPVRAPSRHASSQLLDELLANHQLTDAATKLGIGDQLTLYAAERSTQAAPTWRPEWPSCSLRRSPWI
jgi:hypothetical protein